MLAHRGNRIYDCFKMRGRKFRIHGQADDFARDFLSYLKRSLGKIEVLVSGLTVKRHWVVNTGGNAGLFEALLKGLAI